MTSVATPGTAVDGARARVEDSTSRRSLSASAGDYLKAIWEVAGTGAASTSEVAARLSFAPASVTRMFARLGGMGLVEYERYHGATLTESGRAEAVRLVRRRRLIETFLVERLGYHPCDARAEAERMEHAVSDAFTDGLANLLGHPARDPRGDRVPRPEGASRDGRKRERI